MNWNALLAAILLSLSMAGGASAQVLEGDFEASRCQMPIANETSDQSIQTSGTCLGNASTHDTAGDALVPGYSPKDLTLYDDTKQKRVRAYDYGFRRGSDLGRRTNQISMFEKAIIRNMSILMREYLNARSNTEVLVCEATYRISADGRIKDVEIVKPSADEDFDAHVKDALNQVRLLVLSATNDQECRSKFSSLRLRFKEEPQIIAPGSTIDWSKPVVRPDIF